MIPPHWQSILTKKTSDPSPSPTPAINDDWLLILLGFFLVFFRQSLGQGYFVPPSKMQTERHRMWLDWSTATRGGERTFFLTGI